MNENEKAILTGTPVALTKTCLQILRVLRRAKAALSRQLIADRIQVNEGITFGDGRVQGETVSYNFLAETHLIDVDEFDTDGGKLRMYTITQRGREALDAAKE
jgi:hypothetical protein